MSVSRTNETYNLVLEDMFTKEDIDNRSIYINGDIDETVISDVVYHIVRYNRTDLNIPVEKRKPIILFINSVGGSVSEGFSLIDVIKLSKTPVYTVNLANCLSMGLLIFIAGHKRYAMPHSQFLLHDGTSGGFDSSTKIQDRMKFEAEQLEVMMKDYIVRNTKITDETYDANLRREWYFLPHEGKEIGVVDYIVGEDCGLDEIL